MSRYIGIDADMKALAVRIIHSDNRWEEYEIPFTETGLRCFETQLKKDDRIALEASLNSHYLYERFSKLVAEVVLANPMKLKVISGSHAKSDRNDAGKIALLYRIGYLPTIWVADKETQQDRELLRYRCTIVRDRTKVKTRLRALLASYGLICPSTDIQHKDAQLFLQKILIQLPWTAREKLESLLRQLEMVEKELAKMNQVIETRADRYPQVNLLTTISGMDTLTALTVISIIGDITRFPRPESLANYAGMVPRQRSSGAHSWSGSISKAGSRLLRWAVTEVVRSLVRQPGSFQALYLRLQKHKKKGVALVACGRKLLEVIWHMLTRNERFREINPRLNTRKQSRCQMRPRARKTTPHETLPVLVKNMGVLRELTGPSSPTVPIPCELRSSKWDKKQALKATGTVG